MDSVEAEHIFFIFPKRKKIGGDDYDDNFDDDYDVC